MRRLLSKKIKIQGFTITGILITTAIIVAALYGANYIFQQSVTFVKEGWDHNRKEDLKRIQTALENYRRDYGEYPPDINFEIFDIDWGVTDWQPYMRKMPGDPKHPQKRYIYYSFPDNNPQMFYLYASLDDLGDPDLCNAGQACENVPRNATCGEPQYICNYGVSSDNTNP